MSASIAIVEAGWSSTVQDRGRAGMAHIGVPPAGAVDPRAAALVNRLVGNHERAAVLETCGGLTIRADSAVLVASSRHATPTSLAASATLTVPVGGGRLWHYVAVRGGIDVAPVLGSRSSDTLSALGPEPLRSGQHLAIGPDPATEMSADLAPVPELSMTARVSHGPRTDWFSPSWVGHLTGTDWIVASTSRIGVRLTGGTIERIDRGELPSEGLVRGAIQVPPDGEPVMMSADHPTTGGYPVVAVVHPDDVVIVAQRSTGQSIRFRM